MYVIARDHSKRFSSSLRAFPTLSFSSVSIQHTCAPLRIIHKMHNKHFLAVPFVGYERRRKRALSCWYLDRVERQSMSESSPVWKHESVRNIPSYFRNLKNFHRRASLESMYEYCPRQADKADIDEPLSMKKEAASATMSGYNL
jgi:hypothetical protein